MNWNEAIDIYCERESTALLAEPLNLISNAAFLIASYFCLKWYGRRAGQVQFPILYLSFLLALIGIGSALFHSFATRWAALADTLPIQLFILSYFWLWLRYVFKASLLTCFLGVLSLFFGTWLLGSLLSSLPLNGSQGYLGPLIALFAIGLYHYHILRDGDVLAAAVIFTISLAARTVDQGLCPSIPFGTHFVWHLLNAFVCFQVIRGFSRARQSNVPEHE